MPTLLKALVSHALFALFAVCALLLGTFSQVIAQTTPAAPVAPAVPAATASSPAATAAQQGLSESILRQAQGPYRMIMNSPTVVRPKPAVPAQPAAARVAVPVAIPQSPATPMAVVPVELPLVALRQEEPLLPGPLARERPTGVVQVGFNVNPDGSTGDVSVISSTNRKLNSAVVNAVSKWVYQPLEAARRLEVAIESKNDQ